MRKRILFVEENLPLLQIYSRALESEREWEVLAATNAWQALELMEHTTIDIVVAELRLTGMSGVELVGEVRKRFPLASRIILSEISDQEEVARCLNSVHQFLAKPFEVRELKAILGRIGALDAYLQDEKLKALVSQFGTLPSLPSLYVEIMKELAGDDPSLDKVADIIGKDPSMTARMLQIVNSAVLGLARKISSPFEAIQYLGFGTVRSLVISAHIFSSYERASLKGFSVGRLWKHALASGRLAQAIMTFERADSADAEDAYVAGMLHDLGKLMLADSVPERFQKALALSEAQKIPLHEAEMKILGADHAGAAAYLMGLWGLPAPIVEAIAFHHTPARSNLRIFGPLTAVHVADALEHEMSHIDPCGGPAQVDREYLGSIGLETRLDVWRARALELLESPE